MRSNYRRPLPPPDPGPVVPGLGPDSVVALDPDALAARRAAAQERQREAEHAARGQGLAERVSKAREAMPEVAAPPRATKPPRPRPPAQELAPPAEPRPAAPFKGFVMPARRPEPEGLTAEDLATLVRLVARERAADPDPAPLMHPGMRFKQ